MRSMILRSVLVSTCVAAALALSSAPGAAQQRVPFGIVTATTGPLAAPGKFQMNGFNLAAEEINAAGGFDVAGKKYQVELKVYDVHASPAEGASAMQRLTTVDQVPVVLGELSSAAAGAEAPIAQDNQVPFILTVTTGPELTKQKNAYVFRVNANSDQLAAALADFIVKQGWSPLSFIAWNNDAGRGGVNGMRKVLPADFKLGYVGYFNVGEVDFASHITNIRSSGAKAVMLLMDEEPGSLAIAQIRAADLPVQIVGTLAMGSDRFLARLDAKRLAGMIQYNAFPPNAPLPRIKAFSDRYKAKFGEEAHGFAAQSYDGLMVAIAAMQAAKTVTDGAKIRDALAKITHDGVIGRIKFDAEGQANPPVYVTQWCDDGKRRILYPADMVAGCGAG
jgi:branched-chain amino acid transport system substrate-binding protein